MTDDGATVSVHDTGLVERTDAFKEATEANRPAA
jgi:hypothetical protein